MDHRGRVRSEKGKGKKQNPYQLAKVSSRECRDVLKHSGLHVFLTEEELLNQSLVEMSLWCEPLLKTLLLKGCRYRLTPSVLSEGEISASITNSVIRMSYTIRKNFQRKILGDILNGAEEWAKTIGVRNIFKWHKTEAIKGLAQLDSEFAREIEKGYEVTQEAPSGRGRLAAPKVSSLGSMGDKLHQIRDKWQAKSDASYSQIRSVRVTSNLTSEELRVLEKYRNHHAKLLYESSDKGGAPVVVSQGRKDAEAYKHIQSGDYLTISSFEALLGERPNLERSTRVFEGGGVGDFLLRRDWGTSLSLENVDAAGMWNTSKNIVAHVIDRLERYLCLRHEGLLPKYILVSILAREFPIKSDVPPPNEKYGLGVPSYSRRERYSTSKLEVLFKLHKVSASGEVATRPVARAYNSPLKALEKLVGRLLTQLIEGLEGCRESSGKSRIILLNSLAYVSKIEELNIAWHREIEAGKHASSRVEMYTFDVNAMYPSFKKAYIISQVDEALVTRIRAAYKIGRIARLAAERFREVVMRLLIFVLEHNFVESINTHGEVTYYYQYEGLGIGSSCSGIIANVVMWVGEVVMLEKFENAGYRVDLYKRYLDDIFIILVMGANQLSQFEEFQKQLDLLDARWGSVTVTGERRIYPMVMDMGVYSVKDRVEEQRGFPFLDLSQLVSRNGLGWMSLQTKIYRKACSYQLPILPSSCHTKAVRMGTVRGELLRFLTLSSLEEYFEGSWVEYRSLLLMRGYVADDIEFEKERVLWATRAQVIADRALKRASKLDGAKGEGGVGEGGVGLCVSICDRPGASQWWKGSQVEEILKDCLTEAERSLLPSKLFLSRTRTLSLQEYIKKKV